MNQFFKNIVAATIGVIAAFVLMFFFFIVFLGSLADTKPTVAKNTVLEIDLSAQIPEVTGNMESSPFDYENADALGLNTIKQLIEKAADDKKVAGILIKNTYASGGQATLASIREALEEFKASDKFIYSYADMYSQSAYYIGSVADSVYLNPLGMIDIKGFSTFIPFYKAALDKVGVSMNIFYAGNFKSATEPFRREDMSEENKIQTKEFLDDMVNHFKTTISESRNLSVEEVDEIMTAYKGRNAKSCLENGLVDGLVYWDEVEALIRKKLDIKDSKKINFKTLNEYNNAVTLRYGKSSADEKIAVVYAEGTITYATNDKGSISEDKYLDIFKKLRNDENVKAVVLRVNSPGGNSLTSDINVLHIFRCHLDLSISEESLGAHFNKS